MRRRVRKLPTKSNKTEAAFLQAISDIRCNSRVSFFSSQAVQSIMPKEVYQFGNEED